MKGVVEEWDLSSFKNMIDHRERDTTTTPGLKLRPGVYVCVALSSIFLSSSLLSVESDVYQFPDGHQVDENDEAGIQITFQDVSEKEVAIKVLTFVFPL